ncbi:unnamed protein product [Jaminaea pallidilutea]
MVVIPSSVSLLAAALLTLAVTTAHAVKTPVYLIRHGEKPADGGNGLSAMGVQRSQCLRDVFGTDSRYNVGYIMAQEYKPNGKRKRPYDTVYPLSQDLGLTVDHDCDRDDTSCVISTIKSFNDGNPSHAKSILIAWEHDALSDISKALGDEFVYPDERYDLIFKIVDKELSAGSPYSEGCPGLDR